MYDYPKHYDVIVVGGGHAGIEAALAAARIGCQALLITMNLDTIGQMSCNPAIGGLAKGHLVREIDALGGEMGKATDLTGLQFRMLNTKKGAAVRAPRAQCDKKAYQFRMKWACERQPNLDIKQGQTSEVICHGPQAVGIETDGRVRFYSKTVILTTGTFLRGLMHIGDGRFAGGRSGEPAATGLTVSLKRLGLELGRLKTGTPPRLLRKSIDFSKTESQPGDFPIPFFTHWMEDLFHVEHDCNLARQTRHGHHSPVFPKDSILERIGGQLPCFITSTTEETARIIRSNISLSPLYAGAIEGVGPRYCPSIEDKIMKFAQRERHQIFLEPEGIATDEVYVNGLSTSLPFEVQVPLVRSVLGCEQAEIVRPAYAVEYDFVYPTQLHSTLEAKTCRSLFMAGQINGTSGYEEAAAQGLIAGINAARRTLGQDLVTLERDQAYIGVLIDDLVTKGTTEPYRMFTSRAEYRLLLRQDNADLRLSEIGHRVGLLPEHKYRKVSAKQQLVNDEIERLRHTRHDGELLSQLLSRPDVTYSSLPGNNPHLPVSVTEQVEIEIKYAGYIQRQDTEVKKAKYLEHNIIPDTFDYSFVPSLRMEARQKLAQIRPRTLGQASRISGVSPADISILAVWLKRSGSKENSISSRPTEIHQLPCQKPQT